MQLTEYFSSNLKAAPETLGDPQREAPEDIQERYERVIASSFTSLSALLVLYSKGDVTTHNLGMLWDTRPRLLANDQTSKIKSPLSASYSSAE